MTFEEDVATLSRSMAKRIAVQNGEPFPDFNERARLNAELAEESQARWAEHVRLANQEVDDA